MPKLPFSEHHSRLDGALWCVKWADLQPTAVLLSGMVIQQLITGFIGVPAFSFDQLQQFLRFVCGDKSDVLI